ncbi:MAG: DUF4404 family protein [Gammaproteobacteria bacterium]|nr:MAG: DUF4404 family protein [Gammaproteobacteria bacterium]
MPEKRLKELVRRLDDELESTESVSTEDRALLGELMEDIGRVVGEAEHPPTLRQKLNEAVKRLEDRHSTITLLLKQTLDTLERIGI